MVTSEAWELVFDEVNFDENDPKTILGEGSFGVVRSGVWQGHTVAIKRLLHKHNHSTDMLNAFVNEIRVWHPLRHPNILLLYGACVNNTKTPIMVMELMKTNLQHKLQNEDLPASELLRIMYEISLGMNYLHSNRKPVLHGDLKSANVLLDSQNIVKISDFGFARLNATSAILSTSNPTPDNRGGGTYFWMSPERLSGGNLTAQVDVYAFGMTCFEIFSGGKTPFADKIFDIGALIGFVVHQNGRPNRPTGEKCSDYIWMLIERCWDKLPERRPKFADIVWYLEVLKAGDDPFVHSRSDKIFFDDDEDEESMLNSRSHFRVLQQQAHSHLKSLSETNKEAADTWESCFGKNTWEVDLTSFFAAMELEIGDRFVIDRKKMREQLDPEGRLDSINLGLFRVLTKQYSSLKQAFQRFEKKQDLPPSPLPDVNSPLAHLRNENPAAYNFWVTSFVDNLEANWDEFLLALQQELEQDTDAADGPIHLDRGALKKHVDPEDKMDKINANMFRIICRKSKDLREAFKRFQLEGENRTPTTPTTPRHIANTPTTNLPFLNIDNGLRQKEMYPFQRYLEENSKQSFADSFSELLKVMPRTKTPESDLLAISNALEMLRISRLGTIFPIRPIGTQKNVVGSLRNIAKLQDAFRSDLKELLSTQISFEKKDNTESSLFYKILSDILNLVMSFSNDTFNDLDKFCEFCISNVRFHVSEVKTDLAHALLAVEGYDVKKFNELLIAPIHHMAEFFKELEAISKTLTTTTPLWNRFSVILTFSKVVSSILSSVHDQVINFHKFNKLRLWGEINPISSYAFLLIEIDIGLSQSLTESKQNGTLYLFSNFLVFKAGKSGFMFDFAVNEIVVRDLDDYFGSLKKPKEPFNFEASSIKPKKQPSQLFITMDHEDATVFCSLLSRLKKFGNQYEDSGEYKAVAGNTCMVMREFENRNMREIQLRQGSTVEILEIDANWCYGISANSNHGGFFPASVLFPTCSINAPTDGIYTIYTNYPKLSNRSSPLHPLHIPLSKSDRVIILKHSLRNHLYVYGRNLNTLMEGWFPIFGTLKGAFRCIERWECVGTSVAMQTSEAGAKENSGSMLSNVGYRPKTPVNFSVVLRAGEVVDVENIHGFESVTAYTRKGSKYPGVKVKVPLYQLEPISILE
ncbi:hypothetical protein HK098_006090 [Nowakowskiella sp. JEL0407]|nr:hypothetical protein HK098_006090 [Nowakowskiella sp. JEL0407]